MAATAVMPAPPPSAGMISFMSNDEMNRQQTIADQQQAEAVAASQQQVSPLLQNNLVGLIRREYDIMRRHRDSAAGWSTRMLKALRAINGQYDPDHLAEIRKFQGSESYLRMTAVKCRGASSLLRDVYLNADRPWGLVAEADPEVPVDAIRAVMQKVQIESLDAQRNGFPVGEEEISDRVVALMEAVKDGIKRKNEKKVKVSEDKIEDILNIGGFYRALSEFIIDLPIFPFACLKGPEVKIVSVVVWENGVPRKVNRPRLTWARVSPFDLWFSPGASDIEDADVIERVRYTRAELNVLLDLPGYDHDAVRQVLTAYANGYNDDWESTDSERAFLENRENPLWNQSRMITGFKYSGNVQGLMLLQYGMDPAQIEDPVRDYAIEAWCIGQYVIKVQLAPSTGRRHNYYVTSFEKLPGTPVGNGLPDIMSDIQDGTNATFRSLMNNLSMASGPQVVVMDDRLAGSETGDDIYPWKRWHVLSDPFATSSAQKPVDFFQPQSNAAELLGVLQALNGMGDDVSAIPRYLQGNSPGGGAGRTASGLAMLMGNASKLLQTVAANIDGDVIDKLLKALLDLILLTDTTDILDGTENVTVKGVAVALQRETQRSRQLEFLQITANPIDTQIMGPSGRATVLRSVSQDLGMPGEKIVPTDDDINKMQEVSRQNAMAAGAAGFQPNPPEGGQPGQPEPEQGGVPGGQASGGGIPAPVQSSTLRAGPRENVVGRSRSVTRFQQGGLVPRKMTLDEMASIGSPAEEIARLQAIVTSQGNMIHALTGAQG